MEEEENNKQRKLKIILASSSPRRESILRQLKINFKVMEPLGAAEKILEDPYETVVCNSTAKAQFIYNHVIINNLNYKNTVIAGFDTIVYFEKKYFGKPENITQAELFLKAFSGKSHLVITGISVIKPETGKMVSGTEATKVKFRIINNKEITNYLKTEDVLDKAGAYDISGFGSILVEKIKGCFYNVAGLPVYRLIKLLDELGYKVL